MRQPRGSLIRPGNRAVQRLSYWHFILFFGAFARVRVTGREHCPRQGGFLLAPNHASPFDPFLLTVAAQRWVDWVAMVELYRNPILRCYWNALAAIPVDRSRPGRRPAATVLQRLAAGRAVGIFPETGIRHGTQSVLHGAAINPGVCRLAAAARVPVVPVAIAGSESMLGVGGWLFPRRAFAVRIAFGAPLRADSARPPREAAAQLHDLLAESLRALGRTILPEGRAGIE